MISCRKYEKLNFGRPARFFGHSLSVSDIVEITEDTPDWKQFLNTDEGKAYFSARIKVAEAFADTLTRNMNAMSCTVIDPLSDANYVERRNLYTFMNGRNLSTPEEMKPYLTPLINAYASKVDEDFLKNYGWTRGDLCAVISGNLDPKELTEYVPRGSGEDTREDTRENDIGKEVISEVADLWYNGKNGYIPETKYVPITRKGFFFCDSFGFKAIDTDMSNISPVEGVRCLMLLPGKAPEEIYVPDRLDAWQNAVSDHGEESLMEVTYPFDDIPSMAEPKRKHSLKNSANLQTTLWWIVRATWKTIRLHLRRWSSLGRRFVSPPPISNASPGISRKPRCLQTARSGGMSRSKASTLRMRTYICRWRKPNLISRTYPSPSRSAVPLRSRHSADVCTCLAGIKDTRQGCER